MKHLRFTGKFSTLKPLGFEFQRLYARNYNQWCIRPDGTMYGDSIRIWQKDRDVSIKDFHSASFAIAEYVTKFEPNCLSSADKDHPEKRYYHLCLDIETQKVENFDPKKHDPMWSIYNPTKLNEVEDRIIASNYRDIYLFHSVANFLCKWMKAGLFEVAEMPNSHP